MDKFVPTRSVACLHPFTCSLSLPWNSNVYVCIFLQWWHDKVIYILYFFLSGLLKGREFSFGKGHEYGVWIYGWMSVHERLVQVAELILFTVFLRWCSIMSDTAIIHIKVSLSQYFKQLEIYSYYYTFSVSLPKYSCICRGISEFSTKAV